MKLMLKEMYWKEKDRANYIDLCTQILNHKKKLLKEKEKNKKKGPAPWKTAKDKATKKKLFAEHCKAEQEKMKPIQKKILELRAKKQEIGMKFFAAKLSIGKHEIKEGWSEAPIKMVEFDASTKKAKRSGISVKLFELFKKIKQDRMDQRHIKYSNREALGFQYAMVVGGKKSLSGAVSDPNRGGVFKEPGTILKLMGTVNDDMRLNAIKKPLSFKKDKYVGVEIELIAKCSKEYLMDLLIESRLQSYVQIKSDGSIQTSNDHPHPYELVIMATEEEIGMVIDKVCAILKNKRVVGIANNSCGLHVHLDMRHRNVEEAYRKLYYSQSILLGMVPNNRKDGSHAEQYCKKNLTASFKEQVALGQRYYVINTQAYNKYKTLEIRVHSGTTNAIKIKNWIKMLTSIVNGATVPEAHLKTNLDKFCHLFGIDMELRTYIEKRTKKFEDVKIDTVVDERDAA